MDFADALGVPTGRFFATAVTVTRVPVLPAEEDKGVGDGDVRELAEGLAVFTAGPLRTERLVLIISDEGTIRAP